MLLVVLYLFL